VVAAEGGGIDQLAATAFTGQLEMPRSSRPFTPTSRRISSHAASRLATGRPSGVSWIGEREVVKPSRPREWRRAAALHRGELVRGRRLIEGALAHHVRAQRGVPEKLA